MKRAISADIGVWACGRVTVIHRFALIMMAPEKWTEKISVDSRNGRVYPVCRDARRVLPRRPSLLTQTRSLP